MHISDKPPEETTLELVEQEILKSTHQIESLSQRIENHSTTAAELARSRDKWVEYSNRLTLDALKLRGL